VTGSHDKNWVKEASVAAMLFHLHGWEMGARSMVLAKNVGIDPGRSNIIYAVKVTITGGCTS
jgi:hypothetical protein